MRRSSSTVPAIGINVTALLLIGSILLVGRDESDLTVSREPNHRPLWSAFHRASQHHLWRLREGAKNVTLTSYRLQRVSQVVGQVRFRYQHSTCLVMVYCPHLSRAVELPEVVDHRINS